MDILPPRVATLSPFVPPPSPIRRRVGGTDVAHLTSLTHPLASPTPSPFPLLLSLVYVPQSFLAIQTDNAIVTPGGLLLGAAACGLAGKMFLDRFDAIDVGGLGVSDWLHGPYWLSSIGVLVVTPGCQGRGFGGWDLCAIRIRSNNQTTSRAQCVHGRMTKRPHTHLDV
jgi:hypothetical protein